MKIALLKFTPFTVLSKYKWCTKLSFVTKHQLLSYRDPDDDVNLNFSLHQIIFLEMVQNYNLVLYRDKTILVQ